MKKATRFLAVCLCLCLLCSIVVTASAETGYFLLKTLYSDPTYEDAYLGSDPSVSTCEETIGKMVMLWYSCEEESVTLAGENLLGTPEITWWQNIDFVDGLCAIYAICANYETMAGYLDEGYSLVVGLDLGSDSETIWVDSAAAAEEFTSALMSVLESNTEE